MAEVVKKLFLSYAEEDALVVRNVYLDLVQTARLEVWGYKEKGRIGIDFKAEFEGQLRASDYFCLFDSPHARASSWIRHECSVARSTRAQVVCLKARPTDDAEWRRIELFDGHNRLRGIDLTDYRRGIRQLFDFLEVAYRPNSGFPRDEDFKGEIFRADSGLSPDHAEELFLLYREIREQFADYEFVEAQLRVVIAKAKHYGATRLISPALALGVILGEGGRHDEARRIFAGLTEAHPTDPRGWAALGGAWFFLAEYDLSLQALVRSREVALACHDEYRGRSAERIAEVVHNIAHVQLLLGKVSEARAELEALADDVNAHPFIQGLRGRLLMIDGRYSEALPQLRAAYDAGIEAPELTTALADCYWKLQRPDDEQRLLRDAMSTRTGSPRIYHRAADSFLRHGDRRAAIAAMRQAAACSQESPQYRAQLAALLHGESHIQEAEKEADECVQLAARTAHERYYRGLAYFVLGKRQLAEDELAASRQDPIVSTWPHYSAITRR